MWYYETSFYQFYTLGFCEAPAVNDGITVPRIRKVLDFIPHLEKLGIGSVYFCPLFESDSHGYDTRDYSRIDCRLGTNEDFSFVCNALHKAGIRVVLDGVFNHVGRGFFGFLDVLKNREQSPYKDWFYINFSGNNDYNDNLWYEGWEGHFELVKLNLDNPQVVSYLLERIGQWIDEFDIDGLRLDVAYMLNPNFMKQLRAFCDNKKADFFLLGEMIHGDYNRLIQDDMLHSATNYECYKGLYSSFNSMNMFEIGHSLLRQFGPENWTLYRGKHLLNFADNHDVTRIYSILNDKSHIRPLYALLLGMPGIPCIYYGSEWGMEGRKEDGDAALRQSPTAPVENELTEWLCALLHARNGQPALFYGGLQIPFMTNHQLILERSTESETVYVAVNASADTFQAHFPAKAAVATDLITGESISLSDGLTMPGYSAFYLKI